MSTEKYFDKDFLIEELDLPECAVYEELVDNTRWSLVYRIVFECGGKYYQAYYERGATEYQYQSPWENEDRILCKEVERKEVLVQQWVIKNE